MRMWACRFGVDLTRACGPFVGPAGRKISMLDGSEAGSTSNLPTSHPWLILNALFEFSSQHLGLFLYFGRSSLR